jgi:hypothetical protein
MKAGFGDDGLLGGADQRHAEVRRLADVAGPLEWNAILIEGEVIQAVPRTQGEAPRQPDRLRMREQAHTFAQQGLVDEFWFWVNRTSGGLRPGDNRTYQEGHRPALAWSVALFVLLSVCAPG